MDDPAVPQHCHTGLGHQHLPRAGPRTCWHITHLSARWVRVPSSMSTTEMSQELGCFTWELRINKSVGSVLTEKKKSADII